MKFKRENKWNKEQRSLPFNNWTKPTQWRARDVVDKTFSVVVPSNIDNKRRNWEK